MGRERGCSPSHWPGVWEELCPLSRENFWNFQVKGAGFYALRKTKPGLEGVKVSDVIGRRKLKFYRDTLGLTVLSVWHVTSIWLETCPCLAAYVVHCLSDFVTRVSLICLSAFLSLFKYLAAIYGKIKMCVGEM